MDGRVDDSELWQRLRATAMREWDLDEAAADEFAFHMTDWLDDLDSLNALLASSSWNPEQAARTLRAILCHVPAHIAADSFIAYGLPVKDVFRLGAVVGDGAAERKPGEAYDRS
ncbi:MAG: hypothetical protein H6810_03500 [Phycisphaeraceae bacterium]|nr:MAG: hypothetical protein H6810_03500 [Phycisphaeraceae bacterium]